MSVCDSKKGEMKSALEQARDLYNWIKEVVFVFGYLYTVISVKFLS